MWDVLRRCSRIPRENSGAKRRLAYAEAVLTMWETPDAYGHPDDDYLLAGDKGLRPIPTLRARWGAKQFGRIYDRLFDTMVRGEHDLARVERILQNAATKRFPARYIDAVIKNYEADKRVRRSQRQTKKCDFPK